MNRIKQDEMKMVKFLLAAIAGFGLIKLYKYVAEVEFEEDDADVYDEEQEYPLFV